MRPWNPYSLTAQGNPITGQVPARLVVYGPPLTPVQAAQLQGAYASFRERARLSVVPNPNEQGLLPDGSPYTMAIIGNTPHVTVQTRPGDDSQRNSGIGIVFTTMAGDAVPGHILSGTESTPQPYVLTPEVRKGTRICTGKWRVRKVNGFSGGKAVFSNSSGTSYFVGIAGDTIENLPAWGPGMLGINAAAYQYGVYDENSFVFRNMSAVATFRSEIGSIPFARRSSANTTWAMQLVPVLMDPGSEEPHKLQLYGGPYEPSSTSPVGDLIATLDVPDDYVSVRSSVSFSADGNTIRMMFSRGGDSAVVDLAVTDTSLTITSLVPKAATVSGTPTEETGGTSYNEPPVVPPGYTGTFVTYLDSYHRQVGAASWSRTGGGGFDLRGDDVEIESFSSTRTQDRDDFDARRTVYQMVDGGVTSSVATRTFRRRVTNYRPGNTLVIDGVAFTTPLAEFRENIDYVDTETSVSGGGVTYATTGTYLYEVPNSGGDGSTFIFFDPITRFSITRRVKSATVTTGVKIWADDDPARPPEESEFAFTTSDFYSAQIIVRFGDTQVLEIPVPEDDNASFSTFAAADPLTGALVVNLLKLAAISREVLRSWVFVVDDTGARELSAILSIPGGLEIKALSDNHLLSV